MKSPQELAEFKKKTLEETDKFLTYDHVGEAIKECLENLKSVVRNLEQELSDLSAGSADTVLMKRRYDQLKSDYRAIERKFEKFNEKTIPLIAVELKNILKTSVSIGAPANPIKESAQKIANNLK